MWSDWQFATHPQLVAVASAALSEVPEARRAAADAALVALSAEVEGGERGAWGRAEWKVAPSQDAAVANLWANWAAGQPFGDQAAWLKLLSKPVVGSFRQALSSRPLPPDVVQRALADLQESLFFQLLGGKDGASGFRELAVTVLESAPTGPMAPLLAVLSDGDRTDVAHCVSRRGHWPDTMARVLPDLPGPTERALHLRGHVNADEAEAWLDLHVVLRLIRTWTEHDLDAARDKAIVVQNRGRARGRLRAVATRRSPQVLLGALLDIDALADRTRMAARRWAWAWAWDALATGFSFDFGRPVIRPCRTQGGPEPLDGEQLEILQAWSLLVIVRGRWSTLARWSKSGEGDKDGTWGRLLSEVPGSLRGAGGSMSRVRAALAADGPAIGARLTPVVEAIGALAPGRTLKQAFWACVDPIWHDAVRRPKAGFPTFQRNAALWSHESDAAWGVPTSPEEAQ